MTQAIDLSPGMRLRAPDEPDVTILDVAGDVCAFLLGECRAGVWTWRVSGLLPVLERCGYRVEP